MVRCWEGWFGHPPGMHSIRTAIAGILSLFVASAAVAQQFPTVPPNTVIGRLGGGVAGPAQAIPFATLETQLSGTSTIQPVLVAGSVDNTAVLDAAITRCTSLGGGSILIPVGNWQYATGLTISSQGCNLVGFGRSSKLTYTGTGTGLTISGGLDSLRIGDLTLAASSNSATNLKIYGVNAALAIRGVKFTGGNIQLAIDGAPASGSYGIDVSLCNFEGNTVGAKSISIAPSTVGYAQAITIRDNEFSGFNQAIYHTGSDAVSIYSNRIERHFAGSAAVIHTDTSNGVSIVDNYMEDELSNKPFIESGATVSSLSVIGNRFYPNVGGGTHTLAGVLKTTATASSIIFSRNYIQSLSTLSVLGNIVDTGASKIFGRSNTFNFGTAAYGFASTATSANVDIDGTKVVAGSFTSAEQQLGVARMAADFSNATVGVPLKIGVTTLDGTNSRILYDNNGLLGEYTQAQVGNLVASVANTWSALQSYNDSMFALSGSTSGSLVMRAAAISGSSVIRWPAGSTDFSATGGTSQYLKQASAGAALTVGTIPLTDLPNGTGSYALATICASGCTSATAYTTASDSSSATVYRVTVVGAGGGGGGGNSSFTGGGGGGAGAVCVYVGSGVAASTAFGSVTLGTAGSGGAATSNGTSGTSTSVIVGATTLTAGPGLLGSAGGAGGPSGAGGAGGACTNASISRSGQAGAAGTTATDKIQAGGEGGLSAGWGVPGRGGNQSAVAVNLTSLKAKNANTMGGDARQPGSRGRRSMRSPAA
jgi:hypothetical protein